MIRIKALNDGSDSSDDSGSELKQVTREAEEEGLNKLYTSALKDASENKIESAIEKLHLLKSELENETPKVKDAVLRNRLKYLTYKHLGLFSNDLDLLFDALELDGSDQNLWINTGRKYNEMMSFLMSKRCFEEAYNINKSNFTVIDNLMEIYFILNELYSCVNMCIRALQLDENYFKAIILINESIRLMPRIADDMKDYLGYVFSKYGGEYQPKDENLLDEVYLKTISQLKQIQTKRLLDNEDEESKAKKRRKLSLDIDRLRCRTPGDIGQKILALHEIILSESLNVGTAIMLNISNRDVKSAETENSVSANVASDKAPPANGSSKPSSDSNNNSNSSQLTSSKSLFECVEQRRSVRGKNSKTSSKARELEDEQSVLESIHELLPSSLKTVNPSSQADSSLDKENNSSNSSSAPFPETPAAKTASAIDGKAVDQCLDSLERLFSTGSRPVNIYELIDCFLNQLSTTKHISIPPVFSQLYKIYRDVHPLPVPCISEIGKDITLSHIWTCLTANEIKYDKEEAVFLTMMLEKLGKDAPISQEEYLSFIVRLLVLRGTKEFNNDWLEYSLDLINSGDKGKENVCDNAPAEDVAMEGDSGPGVDAAPTGKSTATNSSTSAMAVVASNNLLINAEYINTVLKMQTMPKATEISSSEKNYLEIIQLIFSKSEAELTVEEKADFCEAIVSAKMWQKGVELFESWSDLSHKTILKTIYECVRYGDRAKLSPRIVSKVTKMASANDCKHGALPWLILYWALVAEGVDYRAADNPLIKLCTKGHLVLGRKGVCTANDGEFLLVSLKVFIEHELEDEVLTAFSCLFNFPSRKSQSCTHTSPHIELKWAHCEQVYVYSEPTDSMPEFDSNARQRGITPDMRDFFLRIKHLVPRELKPLRRSVRITDYLNGEDVNLEDEEVLGEEDVVETPPRILTTIYYLLADWYFKNRDFANARKYYIFDLAYNPRRFDAWAGLALSTNYQLDQLLIEGVRPNEAKYQRTAFAVVQCFEQAMKLDGSNSKLWIEFGFAAYSIASNMGRLVKAAETYQWQLDTSAVRFKREEMLEKAQHCFEMVRNSEKDAEELWLAYYMLGKVSEKKKENLLKTLQYYQWADLCLYIDGAVYPKKINYYSPQYLAMEALEVYYRTHATVLKWLLHNRKFSARMMRQVKWFLLSASKTPFVSRRTIPSTAGHAAFSSSSKKSSAGGGGGGASGAGKGGSKVAAVEEAAVALLLPSGEMVDPAISELMGDLLSLMGERETKFDVNKSRNELIIMCAFALKRCLARYPGHYKSYYRLADEYFVFSNYNIVKGLLLGGPENRDEIHLQFDPESAGSKGKAIPGLFHDRKPGNFFNNIWRIPVDEIERSGNFNQHMYRATAMLIRSHIADKDYQQLVQMSIVLHKKPELDKRYINDAERKELSKLAFEQCFTILRELLNNKGKSAIFIQEIENIAQMFIKAGVFTKETIEICNDINKHLDELN